MLVNIHKDLVTRWTIIGRPNLRLRELYPVKGLMWLTCSPVSQGFRVRENTAESLYAPRMSLDIGRCAEMATGIIDSYSYLVTPAELRGLTDWLIVGSGHWIPTLQSRQISVPIPPWRGRLFL